MFRFVCSGLAAATIAAATAAAVAQQPSTSPSEAASSTSPIAATTQIQTPRDGDLVTSPFKIQLAPGPGMGSASAGVGNGHADLLIDTTLSAEDMTRPIKSDAQHIHFRKDQIAVMATLPSGKHTLQFVLTDANDRPLQPLVQSELVTVTVKDTNATAPASNLESKEAAAARDAGESKKAEEAKPAAEAKRAKPDNRASATPNVRPVKARSARSAEAAHPKRALNKPMVRHPEPHRLRRHYPLHQRHHHGHARHHRHHHGDATPHRNCHAHQHHQHPQNHRRHEHHPSHRGHRQRPNQVSNNDLSCGARAATIASAAC